MKTYKPVKCYRCGEPFRAYTFKDVLEMRIDGKLHSVPVFAIPCMRCDMCDIAVTSSDSDEAIHWWYKKYINDNGLNTPWLRFCRWLRHRLWVLECRWNYYWYQVGRKNAAGGD